MIDCMKSIFYKSSSRGYQDHGWLEAKHTFSFADYYNPERMHFGALRVFNEDRIQSGKGFATHHHENLEIVSIVSSGTLEHKDSMNFNGKISSGEVQVMSAGLGILHSEFNPSEDEPVNLFQIWIYPAQRNIEPCFKKQKFNFEQNRNKLVPIISPDGDGQNKLWLNQLTWFSMGVFDKDVDITYHLKMKENGIFVQVLDGEFETDSQKLENKDAIGIWNTDMLRIRSRTQGARLLIIEVPMDF